MKKLNLTRQTALGFAGRLRKKMRNSGSIVFPTRGLRVPGSKFGSLRELTTHAPHRLTTDGVVVEIRKGAIVIHNPLNATFGYASVRIPFGQVILACGSFFWRDTSGYWRQMKFEKQPGWALAVTMGKTVPYISSDLESDLEQAQKFRLSQERMMEDLILN